MQQIDLLLAQARKLYETGLAIEQEMHLINGLIEQGANYDAPEVLQAWGRFNQAYAEWQRLKNNYQLLNEFKIQNTP